jgi:hypothetical protein
MKKDEEDAVPILAGPWSSDQEGYGYAKPATIFNGGDVLGRIRDIHWSSWGGARAVGHGIAPYVAPSHRASIEAQPEPAKIVAFHLGYCHSRRAYDAVEWYFPEHGGHFNLRQYINACTGNYE